MVTDDLVRLAMARRLARDGTGRRVRQAVDFSLNDVAEHCGVSHVTVRRWEAGERRPSREPALLYADLMVSLARVAGMDLGAVSAGGR